MIDCLKNDGSWFFVCQPLFPYIKAVRKSNFVSTLIDEPRHKQCSSQPWSPNCSQMAGLLGGLFVNAPHPHGFFVSPLRRLACSINPCPGDRSTCQFLTLARCSAKCLA